MNGCQKGMYLMFGSEEIEENPENLRDWTFPKVKQGESIEGWFCGKMYVLSVHWSDPHNKPCCVKMTDGQVPCKCEVEALPIRQVGYVPLMHRCLKKKSVICVSKGTAKLVNAFKPGCILKFTRPTGYNMPYTVTQIPSHNYGVAQEKAVPMSCIHDCRPFLLHIWQIKHLTEHFGYKYIPSASKKRRAKSKELA